MPDTSITNNGSSLWNSLEIAKFILQVVTPLLILGLGIYVNKIIKKFEHFQWRNQKLIEKRLQIYDQIAPLLNDLLCYFTFIGSWKDVSPSQIVKLKRELDKKIYIAAPLFSPSFLSSCNHFMELCYETYTGWGQDAKLKTPYERRKKAKGSKWKSSWNNMFSDNPSDPTEIKKAYQDVMKIFSTELGLGIEREVFPTGGIPANIK